MTALSQALKYHPTPCLLTLILVVGAVMKVMFPEISL